jgi:hypothetical protein
MESMYGTGASERSGPPPKPVSEWVPSAVLAQRARAALVKAGKKDAVINRKGAVEAGGSVWVITVDEAWRDQLGFVLWELESSEPPVDGFCKAKEWFCNIDVAPEGGMVIGEQRYTPATKAFKKIELLNGHWVRVRVTHRSHQAGKGRRVKRWAEIEDENGRRDRAFEILAARTAGAWQSPHGDAQWNRAGAAAPGAGPALAEGACEGESGSAADAGGHAPASGAAEEERCMRPASGLGGAKGAEPSGDDGAEAATVAAGASAERLDCPARPGAPPTRTAAEAPAHQSEARPHAGAACSGDLAVAGGQVHCSTSGGTPRRGAARHRQRRAAGAAAEPEQASPTRQSERLQSELARAAAKRPGRWSTAETCAGVLADCNAEEGGDGGTAEAAPLSPAGLRGQEQPAARPPKAARLPSGHAANASSALVTPAPAARREWDAWDEALAAACDPITGRHDPYAAPLRPLASPGELPPGPSGLGPLGGLDAGAGLCSAECPQHGGESASQASGAPTPSFSAQRGPKRRKYTRRGAAPPPPPPGGASNGPDAPIVVADSEDESESRVATGAADEGARRAPAALLATDKLFEFLLFVITQGDLGGGQTVFQIQVGAAHPPARLHSDIKHAAWVEEVMPAIRVHGCLVAVAGSLNLHFSPGDVRPPGEGVDPLWRGRPPVVPLRGARGPRAVPVQVLSRPPLPRGTNRTHISPPPHTDWTHMSPHCRLGGSKVLEILSPLGFSQVRGAPVTPF